MRPKYHFLTVTERKTGKSIVTLPGQTFGRNPVPDGYLVKDAKGLTQVTNQRKKARPGDVFFTTTLEKKSGFCTVKDIYPLKGNANVLFSDAEDRYEKYKKNVSV